MFKAVQFEEQRLTFWQAFCGFSQFLQANAGILPQLSHDQFQILFSLSQIILLSNAI
jgi:hypothetical protein